jgi:hypothetical protein
MNTGSIDAMNCVWPALPMYLYATSNVNVPSYCDGEDGLPPVPACP